MQPRARSIIVILSFSFFGKGIQLSLNAFNRDTAEEGWKTIP